MENRETDALRAVLFERLLGGEDQVALRAQLVQRLSADEADTLMTEAVQRFEIARSEPEFTRLAKTARKRRDARHRLWTGPISSRRQAERIARETAILFGSLGLLACLASALGGRRDFTSLIAGLLFIVPAMALWRTKSAIAAAFILGIASLSVLSAVIFLIWDWRTKDGLAVIGLGLLAVWLIPLLAALRAFAAARFLRSDKAPSVDASVFD